jgi:hypothetical protein
MCSRWHAAAVYVFLRRRLIRKGKNQKMAKGQMPETEGFLMDEGSLPIFLLTIAFIFVVLFAAHRFLRDLSLFDDGSIRIGLCGDMTLDKCGGPLKKIIATLNMQKEVKVRHFLVNRATALTRVGEQSRTLDSISESEVSSADCSPYIESIEFQNVLQAQPSALVLMLGAHDAAPENWCKAGYNGCTFRQDLTNIAKNFLQVPKLQMLIICAPLSRLGSTAIESTVAPALRQAVITLSSLVDVQVRLDSFKGAKGQQVGHEQ